MARLFCLSTVIGLFLVTLCGCGSKDPFPMAPVEGAVTYQGKPVERGQVVFAPAQGVPGPPAVGNINKDGSFRMTTSGRDGAAIGKHVVTVHSRREPTEQEARSLVITESLIPLYYGQEDKTPLSIDVKEGDNELPIELE